MPNPLERYVPRACDCDFCVQRKISYLSDPYGELEVEAESGLYECQQGSQQARFVCCKTCDQVVAAVYSDSEAPALIGAVNATLLADFSQLPAASRASPKALSAREKRQRWQQIWMPVKINPGALIK